MEEKSKISLSTFGLILSLVIIVIMGCFIFKLYNEKQKQNKYIEDLNLTNNQDSQDVTDNTDDGNSTKSGKDNGVISSNIFTPLKAEELFYCEDVIANKDGTYTFRGRVCEPYKISAGELKEMIKQDVII